MVAFLSIIEAQPGTGKGQQTPTKNETQETPEEPEKNVPEKTSNEGKNQKEKDGNNDENDDGKSNGKTTTPGNGASGISCSMLLIASTTMIALFASSCADLK